MLVFASLALLAPMALGVHAAAVPACVSNNLQAAVIGASKSAPSCSATDLACTCKSSKWLSKVKQEVAQYCHKKSDYNKGLDYVEAACAEYGVKVHLNKRADDDDADADEDADAVTTTTITSAAAASASESVSDVDSDSVSASDSAASDSDISASDSYYSSDASEASYSGSYSEDSGSYSEGSSSASYSDDSGYSYSASASAIISGGVLPSYSAVVGGASSLFYPSGASGSGIPYQISDATKVGFSVFVAGGVAVATLALAF